MLRLLHLRIRGCAQSSQVVLDCRQLVGQMWGRLIPSRDGRRRTRLASGVTHNVTRVYAGSRPAGQGATLRQREGYLLMETGSRVSGSSDFGALLRRYRLAAGLSQEALAERARMSSDGVSALERGHRRTPQRETLALLAGALALSDRERQEFELAAARPSTPRREASAAVTVGPWPGAERPLLPLALTRFVGRLSELQEITALVREHRLVTLTGSGGVGKTQTALQVAGAMRDADDALVYFAGLAPLSDPSLVASAIASALGVQEVPDRPLLETLIAFLKNRTLLLVLDNCEHVINEAASVAYKLLFNCPRLRIVATSREALRTAGERAYRLPSLSIAEAVELFTDRARAADYYFALSNDDEALVGELCRRLDGIPLAIEMAATRVETFTPREMLAMLAQRFALLSGADRVASDRQQTMWATLDWSYELLSKREKVLFDRISIFAGGCTLELATSVCADEGQEQAEILELLSSLSNKSLVTTDHTSQQTRYGLLETARQYAREKLVARGEDRFAAHRHARAYLELARPLEHAYYYTPEVVSVLVREELDNWRAALLWTLSDRGDALLGQQLVASLTDAWQEFAPVEGSRWLARAQELTDEQTPASVLGALSYTQATICMVRGQDEERLACSRTAAAHYRAAGYSLGLVRAQFREAQALSNLGRFAEQKEVLNEAVVLARSVGDRLQLSFVLKQLAWSCIVDGDFEQARRYAREALQHSEAVGAKLGIKAAKAELGQIEFYSGDLELALRYKTDDLAAARSFNLPRTVAMAQWDLPHFLLALGRFGDAETAAREALAHAREHRFDHYAFRALEQLAAVAVLRPPQAAEDNSKRLAQAAQILGFVVARPVTDGTGTWQNRQELDRLLPVLREALGAETLAELMRAGAEMSEEQVDALALADS